MANWGAGLTVGLVVGLMPLVLRWLSRRATMPPRRVGYGTAPKVFALAVAVGMPLVVLVILALQARPLQPGEGPSFVGLLALFGGLGGVLVLEFFRVRLEYDEVGVDVASPWSRARRLEWAQVTAVLWRPTAKWLDLVGSAGSRRLHVSPMLSGLDGLARVALERLPPAVLEANTTGVAVLRIMRAGGSGALLMSPEPPEKLAAQLGPTASREA